MVRLKVSAEGQITLKKEVLEHLGIGPGDEVDIDLMPSRRASLRVIGKTRPIESLFGMVKNTTGRTYTVEEINEAIAAGYAGEADD
ncbi:AbrB family transcriptional regulator [Rhizobium sp. PP-WC-2G-219]|uniref:AbrB/MazE/SpoVT family DNA-binding domain-containing protein n=1 Tax=Rhizobium sp. PP-CC-3G-465 TaxID=2135648 RepID=UPI000D906C24|nr:AbrB family transcriptional regulator [Rhizobium sp. PP-F2F-G20b]TCL93682.1 AbrB family transcriptional regulator [Rhizobium sp. PP-WC-2G-219]TCQ27659.1 AbrB family transcriptional regulator [Rhizobium sp. PP-CC-3G-465]